MTRRVALIGQPLRRRHSPLMHEAAFAAAGIDARYELREIGPEDVPGFVEAARSDDWYGFQVTAPYKQLVMRLVDDLTPEAVAIGAVNSVVRRDDGSLLGFNTDAPGFRRSLEGLLGGVPTGARVVVAGAGGAARAVAYAILQMGAGRIVVANRHRAGAERLAAQFDGAGIVSMALDEPGMIEELGRTDAFVNATTVGMLTDGMAVPVEALSRTAAVFDLVYVPPETPLLRAARARGLRAANGSDMLIFQAAIAFERWTGVGGMEGVMRRAIQPLLDDPTTVA